MNTKVAKIIRSLDAPSYHLLHSLHSFSASRRRACRPRTSSDVEQQIRDALAIPGRPGFHKIAEQFGVATGIVQRIAQG